MVVAIDYGKKRCGYAVGERFVNRNGVIETPKLLGFLSNLKPDVVVFGLPLSMSGRYSMQTFEAVEKAEVVAKKLKVDVYLKDERLSTRMAHSILKNTKGKTPVDAVSASLIFESFIASPESSYKIETILPDIEFREGIYGKNVLIHNVPSVKVLDFVEAENVDVLQENPYIAYLFKKRVEFVERFERFLKGPYDVIITTDPEKIKDFLQPEGKLLVI